MVVMEPNINYHRQYKAAKSNKKQPPAAAEPGCRPAAAAAAGTLSEKVSGAARLVALVVQKITAAAAEIGDNNIIGKSIGDLMLRHRRRHAAALVCSSDVDVRTSFISPRDVEFSCTSSPPRRRRRQRRGGDDEYRRRLRRHLRRQQYFWNAAVVEAPAFGTSCSARSHCSWRSGGGDGGDDDVAEGGGFHVDKAADEFIERFYRELMMQKWAAAREGSDRC